MSKQEVIRITLDACCLKHEGDTQGHDNLHYVEDRSTVLVLNKLIKFAVALRLRCGSCKLIFDIISSFFAKCKKVVHSLEPGETPSNSASHQAPNYVQRS